MNYVARIATDEELDRIYLMGFDVWSNGASESEYLSGCRASPKYACGKWYVLTCDEQPMSSLITYNLGASQVGIGSIATPINDRKRGYASELIKKVISELDVSLNCPTYFLYADISPIFHRYFMNALVSRHYL